MGTYLLRRLAGSVLLIAVASSLAYLLAAAALHPRSAYAGGAAHPSSAVVDARLAQLNLDDRAPLARRYARWATGVLHGDFGRTTRGEPVNAELGRRLGVTLRLLVPGIVLGGAIGVPLGALSAVRRHGAADRLITAGAFVVMAVPVFVLGALLQAGATAVNDAVGARVLAFSGEYTPGPHGGAAARVGDRLTHLVLPAISVALGQVAVFSRYQRGAMLDAMAGDFVRTARAKGLRRRTALLRHALRTALVPAVTYIAYAFAALLVGTALTERIFGWHGLGEWFADAVARGDANTVAAVTCLAAVLVRAAGTAADVLHAVIDPRVRPR